MNRFMIGLLIAACLASRSDAQSRGGFDPVPAGDRPEAAGDARRAAVVVRKPAGRTLVKTFEVGRQGSFGVGIDSRKLCAGVEKIELYSDGRARWTFSIRNTGGTATIQLDPAECYIVDPTGETFGPVAFEFPPNTNWVRFPAQAKKRFWMEFETPDAPTDTFTVGIACFERFEHPADNFKPFEVKLRQPLSLNADAGPPAEEVEPPIVPLPIPESGTRSKGPTKTNATASPRNAGLDAMRAISERGGWFEGTVRTRIFDGGTGGIVFDKKKGGGLLSARIYFKGITTIPEIKLKGALVEDSSSPGGHAFVFEDKDEVTYRFRLDGKLLEGVSSDNGRFTLNPK